MKMQPLYLKKNHEKRLQAGHPWIFSNEIDVARSPLSAFQAGERVQVLGQDGRHLGSAYLNPKTLLAGRVYSWHKNQPLDADFLKSRLEEALHWREQLIPAPYYRLVFGEGDGLPGLIIDRFGAYLVLQITTAGMELAKDLLIEVLVELLQPEGILLRNDHGYRETEGLPTGIETAYGNIPETTEIIENGLHFEVPLLQGQKTGWFYDQRQNRARLHPYVKNARVLDVCAYLGSFTVHACAYGASSVLAVDSSQFACEQTLKNAALNGFGDRVQTRCEDAFDALKALQAEAPFDVVLIDPPAFIKKKKDLPAGQRAYQKLNQLALACLKPGGILFSSSCSMHLSDQDLQSVIQAAAVAQKSPVQILDYGQQAADHPVHPAIPETHYLKTFVCRKMNVLS